MSFTILMGGVAVLAAAWGFKTKVRPRLNFSRVQREPIDVQLLPTPAGDEVEAEFEAGEIEAEVEAGIADGEAPPDPVRPVDPVPRVQAPASDPEPGPGDQAEDPAQLEAQLRRSAMAPAADPGVGPGNSSIAAATGRSARDVGSETVMTTTTTTPTRTDATVCGLPPDQVQSWLEQVQDDLRRVRARLEYLRAEQGRLEAQQRLLAELLASSTGQV